MKKTEKILLIATIGLGAILGVAYVPGRGRSTAPPGAVAPASGEGPAGTAGAGSRPTLELLAEGSIGLRPIAEDIRNPFRPANVGVAGAGVVVLIRVTAIFGEEGNRAALLRGERLPSGAGSSTGPVIRIGADPERVQAALDGRHTGAHQAGGPLTSDDALLAALLRGKLVRAGDKVGALTVETVDAHEVRLRHLGETLTVPLQKAGSDGRRPDRAAPGGGSAPGRPGEPGPTGGKALDNR